MKAQTTKKQSFGSKVAFKISPVEKPQSAKGFFATGVMQGNPCLFVFPAVHLRDDFVSRDRNKEAPSMRFYDTQDKAHVDVGVSAALREPIKKGWGQRLIKDSSIRVLRYG